MTGRLIVLPPTLRPLLWRRRIVTGLFFLLACAYAIRTPIFEISDEAHHYPVVDYIADHAALPVQDPQRPNLWDWQAAQPPLYYALAALIVAPLDRSDMESHLELNPYSKVGIGLASDNQNYRLHNWEAQAVPWRGTALQVRLVRFFSILLGTVSVWMSFTIGRLAAPQQPHLALLTLLLTAFNPMFLAITGSVNNDNLVICLSSLTFAALLTLWREGFSWGRVLALAVLCTLAAASKVSGMILWIPVGLGILVVIRREGRSWRQLVYAGILCAAVWMVLLGWWYARNQSLYDDLLGNRHMAQTVGLREPAIGLGQLIGDEWFSFFAAYWGWFGAVNILGPMNLFYWAGLLWLLAGLGWSWAAWVWLLGRASSSQTSDWIPMGLLALTLLIAFISLLQWTLLTPASQGRLLFPFIYSLSLGAAYGLQRLLGRRKAGYALAPLMLYSVVCIWIVIPYAFRMPATLTELPNEANPVEARYAEAVELVGYSVDSTPRRINDEVSITLYWRPLTTTAAPLSFYLQVFGPADFGPMEIGKLDSYPGRGLLQTTTWEVGRIYADTYRLEIDQAQGRLNFPFVPRWKVGWRDAESGQDFPPQTFDGTTFDAVVLNGGRVTLPDAGTSNSPLARFGGVIVLHSADVRVGEESIGLNVYWEALTPIHEDFTVFAQLIDPANPAQALAFGDSVPRQGWWPTSAWVAGNPFYDGYSIPLAGIPSGDYEILLGFYRPQDFTRLGVDQPPYPDAYRLTVTLP